MAKKHVYVAGPYTSGGEAANVRIALDMGDRILALGGVPFVPHLFHLWDLNAPKPYEAWMEICLAWVTKCDALVRLPGESAGADREVARARELGLPVFLASESPEEDARLRAYLQGGE